MRVVHHLREVRCEADGAVRRHCVTIGVFDGLHRGHQRIIAGLVQDAHEAGNDAVVITFDPHPATVTSDDPPLLLTTVGERLELMEALGTDTSVVFPFTEQVVQTSAADFVRGLVRYLNLVEIRVGPDFTLGHERRGDIAYLTGLGAKLGFTVRTTEPVTWEGEVVHSSRIRDALQRGDVEEANGCLGRPYRLSGVVVHGRGRGRNIGVPTANMSPPRSRLIPGSGVYACRARTERWGTYAAAVNIGTRPTFTGRTGSQGLTVEAHLLDFDRNLYDQVLALDFVARLRDERAYPTLNALVAQMREDVAQTRELVDVEKPSDRGSGPYSKPPISNE